MFSWLGKLFATRTAVEAARDNPVLHSSVRESSAIYERIPLREFIDESTREALARDLFLDIHEICNSIEPVEACRQKLAVTMLGFATYQVLVIPPPPEVDESGLRGQPGITGELRQHLKRVAAREEHLRTALRGAAEPADEEAVWRIVQREYWKSYWFLESFNAVRIELGDYDEHGDWFAAFRHAACANAENDCRRAAGLPSAFEERIASIAPTAYSIFTDIVISGAEHPDEEWRDYYRDSDIPVPRLVQPSHAPN